MRKKGENSVKRTGKAAIPPDKSDDFTLWRRSQTARYRGHVAMTRSTSTWSRRGVGTRYFGPSHRAI